MSELFRVDVAHEDHFTVIGNHAARNPALSRSAKGLLYELCSHSTEYKPSQKGLLGAAADGKGRLQRSVDELKEHQYLRIDELRESGRYVGAIWRITSDPERLPLPEPENRDTESTVTLKTGTGKQGRIRSNKARSTPPTPPAGVQRELLPSASANGNGKPTTPIANQPAFEALWKLAPGRGSKKSSWPIYQRAVADGADPDVIHGARESHVDDAGEDKFIAHLPRWLRDSRWDGWEPMPTDTLVCGQAGRYFES